MLHPQALSFLKPKIMPSLRRGLALLGVSAAMLMTPTIAAAQTRATPIVAAASNLKFALEEVSRQFTQATGQPIRLIFGSSGNMYSQILQGAPFHLFMSADEDFVLKLAEAGKTQDLGQIYAHGRIGIMVPKGSPLKADGTLQNLADALRNGRIRKFAIANPDHAPYGILARQALQHQGLWEGILPKLVYGENIAQAAQFATSGSTDGGIIAHSLALAPQVARLGNFALIPEAWHKPLAQRMVLIKNAPPAARDFYNYLFTPEAQAIMVKYGFEMPKP